MVQWLRLRASKAGYTGSIPGQGTKIPYAAPLSTAKINRENKMKKKMVREYHEKLYAKLDNLDEMEKFLRTPNYLN